MSEEYDENRCQNCQESLFQHDGEWICPDCDNAESFTLDKEKDSFQV